MPSCRWRREEARSFGAKEAAGAGMTTDDSPEGWYYLGTDGSENGPLNFRIIRAHLRLGTLPSDIPVWREGLTDWTEAKNISLFRNVGSKAVPPVSARDLERESGAEGGSRKMKGGGGFARKPAGCIAPRIGRHCLGQRKASQLQRRHLCEQTLPGRACARECANVCVRV